MPNPKEVESVAITNEDSSHPIQVTVVPTTVPWVNWVVILRPDWNLI
jgi:hypothetical protein